MNKKVSDFPEKGDFSTPETAYVRINRTMASGEVSNWRQISAKETQYRLPDANAPKREVEPEVAKQWLNARIIEVRIFSGRHAVIIAEVKPESKPPFFDYRSVDLENGKWLNVGEDTYDNIDAARARFGEYFAKYVEMPVRPKINDPNSYLKPFVEFLKTKGEEPRALIMKALAKYKLTIMGETHHRPRYWAFNCSLVTDPNFSKNVGAIYMELPSNDQELVDKFLAAKDCNTMPVIEMLRDMLWMGWPDQSMLDFFTTVWTVNQKLEPRQRLRIVLVDMQRPWKNIQKQSDWGKYESVDRDQQMADNIISDIRKHPEEKRNSLFIVGVGHTMLDLRYFEGSPVRSAGWHLRKELGSANVYAIFPHEAVSTNMGRVDGRLCLGLFDSAFASMGNKPIAFPLDIGPFGEQAFDALPDRPVVSRYRDGYNAYLYLGPLETEVFSPLIAGFYTGEFVKELDRRYRMIYGQGLVEGCSLAKLNAESFIAWMSSSWGKPRKDWQQATLGPLNAWHFGSNWKKTIRD